MILKIHQENELSFYLFADDAYLLYADKSLLRSLEDNVHVIDEVSSRWLMSD